MNYHGVAFVVSTTSIKGNQFTDGEETIGGGGRLRRVESDFRNSDSILLVDVHTEDVF